MAVYVVSLISSQKRIFNEKIKLEFDSRPAASTGLHVALFVFANYSHNYN
jgi:hypothetical protein